MNVTDLRVLCTLATMARGVDLEMPSVDQTPRDAVESDNALPRLAEMFLRGNVRLSRRFLVETPHDGQEGQCEEQSQVVHFVREIPDLLLRIELYDIKDSLNGALVALAGRDLIASHGMELALPVGTYAFRTSGRKLYELAARRLEKKVNVGHFPIKIWSEADGVLMETVSRMAWYSMRPRGWELAAKAEQESSVPMSPTPKTEAPSSYTEDAWLSASDMAAQTGGEVQQAQSSSRAAQSSTRGTVPKSGGRPTVSEPEARKREELVGRWNRAKAEGVHQKDFCGDENVSLKYLTKCINWRAQRRRRRNES